MGKGLTDSKTAVASFTGLLTIAPGLPLYPNFCMLVECEAEALARC